MSCGVRTSRGRLDDAADDDDTMDGVDGVNDSTQGAAAGPELDTEVGGESAGRLPESDSVVNATDVDPAVTVNVSVESSGQARAPVGDENTTEGPSAATNGVVEETVASVGVGRRPRTTRHEAETVMRIRALRKIHTGSVFQDGDRSNWNLFVAQNMQRVLASGAQNPEQGMKMLAGEWQQRKGGVVTPDGVFWSEQATDGGGGGRKRMRAVRPDDALYQPVTAHPGRIKTTAENHNILTSYEHSFTDKTKFECLRQAELWREDPTHNGRYQRLQSVQPTAEASQRSTRNAAQGPRPDSRRGPWIKITEPENGIDLATLEEMQGWVEEQAQDSAARHMGVSERYARTVVNAYCTSWQVPEAGDAERGGSRENSGKKEPKLSAEELQAVRVYVIKENIAGRNVYLRPLRAKLFEITGKQFGRRAAQRLRREIGMVHSKVVCSDEHKTSNRVRLQRWQFGRRRIEEDMREPAMRPIRVYSDETYANANTRGKTTWTLTPKAWAECWMKIAQDAMDAGEQIPEAPTNAAGMHTSRGSVFNAKSGKGARAVIINALYALPMTLKERQEAREQWQHTVQHAQSWEEVGPGGRA